MSSTRGTKYGTVLRGTATNRKKVDAPAQGNDKLKKTVVTQNDFQIFPFEKRSTNSGTRKIN